MITLPHKNSSPIKPLAFILGLTSIIGQVLLLRELIVVFYGNEMAYAVILSSWLFWIAAGSFTISRLRGRIKNPAIFLVSLQWATYFILPATIFATRFLNEIMNVQTGETVGIIRMCASSYLLLAPLTFILGSIFTLICRLPNPDKNQTATASVGSIYLWESLGAALGGVLYSFVFIHFMSAFYIAFLVGMINIGAMALLLERKDKLFKFGITLIVVTLLFYFSGGIDKLDQSTRKVQWKGFEIVTIADSIYGNIVLTKMNNEYSLFENGLLSFSTKDELTSEENVHYSLLEHPYPKNVLLIGNGVAGALREILKHPVASLDYIELDPMVIDISRRNLPNDVLAPLGDKRVNVIHADARLLIKHTFKKYDVIIVNLGDPYNAMINRYYSLEFFKEASRIINETGILSLSVSSSENYLNNETRTFLQSIHTTLREAFPDAVSIPGDTNIFLACKKRGVLTYDPGVLIGRLKKRNIQTQYVREYYLPFKLSKDRIFYIKDVLKEKGALNTDMHPVTYLYDILLWSTRFNLTFKQFVENIQWIKLGHLMILPLLLLFVGLLLKRSAPAFAVTTSIVTTGISEIIFQLIVIIAFQTLYGFAYYRIGLIMASFMGGLALGSYVAGRVIIKLPKEISKIYKVTQAGICFYPLLLPGLFIVFRNATSTQNLGFFSTTFAILPIIAGFIGGLQYPLATHLIYSNRKGKGKDCALVAGTLYAADTLGATIGALFTGALLIPLLGIKAVAYFCAAINFAVLILLLVDSYPKRSSACV